MRMESIAAISGFKNIDSNNSIQHQAGVVGKVKE
jgi:hypothetical protein